MKESDITLLKNLKWIFLGGGIMFFGLWMSTLFRNWLYVTLFAICTVGYRYVDDRLKEEGEKEKKHEKKK